MNNNFVCIILAAGEGKRMKSATPKVLHEICSKPMVNYVVDAAKQLSPKRIVVVLSKKRPDVKDVLEGVRVVYQNKPLGTADAVKAAKDEIPAHVKDVVVLYGDTPLITVETLQALYESHLEKNVSCTVLTTFLDNPKGYGRILRNEAGQFIGIIEDKDASYRQKTIREINTGIYCFKREDLVEGLEHIHPSEKSGEFYLTDIFSWFFNRGKKTDAAVAQNYREVLGVNSQADLYEAAKIINYRILDNFKENGVEIMDSATTFIDPSVTIGAGTKIFPLSVIDKDVVIGKDCSIGPFCHLRKGTVLKDKVSIGNFTEIKNCQLGEETFVRHMSYLGDAQLGKNVNIGAGTVIANFDGKKKNKTVIKDKAFVGCDTVLIAPVVVGKNAVVGAGSVVTRNHNVPDGSTVVGIPARAVKKTKKG